MTQHRDVSTHPDTSTTNPPGPPDAFGRISARRYVLTTLRSLAPSIGLSIVGTVAVYLALRPMFPPASTTPLLGALAVPLAANLISLARRRRVDVFAVTVIVGLAGNAAIATLGGDQRILLMRETLLTGAHGLILLASLVLTRPVGYYFARHLLTGNDPARQPHFTWLWSLPRFRRFVRRVTTLWGCLLLGELILQAWLVLTLPVIAVLALTTLVVELPRFLGLAISLLATRRIIADIRDPSREDVDRQAPTRASRAGAGERDQREGEKGHDDE